VFDIDVARRAMVDEMRRKTVDTQRLVELASRPGEPDGDRAPNRA
jgi:hypothetical protein